ncbi:hypothetical protein K450DRAFT_227266 [Umbelopsis ramanniana AG]|uniref:Uncharacterized protein n=1 Tax=Umbelopsis ramanniana AG TaxID=1314678 RepID=A0AAD5EEY6_UMBRA|nr:uncharacterized protein K450DRAFT_227266 [Umbelopsis ramanniana AG]KAI8582458.1 hypothetical protein K450DRAFT_227266 [Umbelopsis ramanniana AG]
MLLEPHPFAESAGQGYYGKSNSPTENAHHAHPISTQEPPATPTPSAMDHHVKYEPPSRRPPFQPVTTLKIPIPRRAEPPPSPDMGRPPHPSAVPASVQAQAALRRPAPKASPPQPAKKGFHVVKYEKYEVKQERYYLPPSVKLQNGSPPVPGRHQQQILPYHHASPPPSNHENTHPGTSEEDETNGSSSDDNNSNSDSSGSGSDGEDDSAPEESDDSDDEEVVEAVIAPKHVKQNGGKRKRATSGTGKINFKEEAGSSFIDKNAHIKRPRNAWIHVSFTPIQHRWLY